MQCLRLPPPQYVKTLVLLGVALLFAVCEHLAFGFKLYPRAVLVSVLLFVLLRSVSTRLFTVWLVLLWGAAAAHAPAGLLYGAPGVNSLTALLGTNAGEALEYLTLLPYSVWFVLAGLTLCGTLLLRYREALPKLGLRSGLLLTLVTALFVLSSPIKNHLKGLERPFLQQLQWIEPRFAHAVVRTLKDYGKEGVSAHSLTEAPQWTDVTTTDKTPEIVVLVIGESARRDFMGAYNPRFSNTPWLSETPGIHFEGYVTPVASTAGSLARVLYLTSDGSRRGDNVVTLMRAAGYHTAWFSAQGDGARISSPSSLVAWRADVRSVANRSLTGLEDEALLEPFREDVAQAGKRFVTLHLIGSHPTACRRTNGERDAFYLSEEVSCYLRSIRHTDALLNEVEKTLKATGRSWSLTYVGDHGLTLSKGKSEIVLRQGDNDRESYRPPFFFTSGDAKETVRLQAARNGRHFLPIFAALNGIRAPQLETFPCAWLTDAACPDQTRITDFHRVDKDLSQLPTVRPEDLKD